MNKKCPLGAADDLIHVHIADSTRETAGLGSTDSKQLLYVLKLIGYRGILTMEFLPRVAAPYAAQDMDTHSRLMDEYPK